MSITLNIRVDGQLYTHICELAELFNANKSAVARGMMAKGAEVMSNKVDLTETERNHYRSIARIAQLHMFKIERTVLMSDAFFAQRAAKDILKTKFVDPERAEEIHQGALKEARVRGITDAAAKIQFAIFEEQRRIEQEREERLKQ